MKRFVVALATLAPVCTGITSCENDIVNTMSQEEEEEEKDQMNNIRSVVKGVVEKLFRKTHGTSVEQAGPESVKAVRNIVYDIAARIGKHAPDATDDEIKSLTLSEFDQTNIAFHASSYFPVKESGEYEN